MHILFFLCVSSLPRPKIFLDIHYFSGRQNAIFLLLLAFVRVREMDCSVRCGSVRAVLTLCCLSWCELCSKYLSVLDVNDERLVVSSYYCV